MSGSDGHFPRFVYVPWTDGDHRARMEEAAFVAVALGDEEGLPVMAVAPAKNDLPESWGDRPYRTRRSASHAVSGPAVEVHIWPSWEDLAAMSPKRAKHAFVIEYPTDGLSGWARHNHAVHFDTNEVLVPGTSDEAMKLYKQIDFNGNNGWADARGERDALRDLRQLRDLGQLDLPDLVGYMIGRQHQPAIRRLANLASAL